MTVADPTGGALAQARRRVGAEPLHWLFDLLRGPAAGIGTAGVWWRGLLVCAIDGTTMAVPDSPANLTRFTKHRCNGPLWGRLPPVGDRRRPRAGHRLRNHHHHGHRPPHRPLPARHHPDPSPPSWAAASCVPAPRAGIAQETYALPVTYQLLRLAMADDTGSRPDIDPDRVSFTIALNTARDLVIQAAGVIADTVIDLVGSIGRRILADPMPDRRIRTRPRVVKRAISKYNAKGTIDRTSYKATISIGILTAPGP